MRQVVGHDMLPQLMPTAYVICAIELPAELGDVLEPDSFRVLEVYFSRDTAIRAVDRLNIDHADTPFCYVLHQANLFDFQPEPLDVTIDFEFSLILVDAGDCRHDVILLVRQILDIPLVLARQMVDDGEAVIVTGSHYQLSIAQQRFDALRAVTRVE